MPVAPAAVLLTTPARAVVMTILAGAAISVLHVDGLCGAPLRRR